MIIAGLLNMLSSAIKKNGYCQYIDKVDNVVIPDLLVNWCDDIVSLSTLVIRLGTDDSRIKRIKHRNKAKFANRIVLYRGMYRAYLEF